MDNLSDRWAAVAEAVRDRMAALALSQADVVKRSGLSDATVRSFMTGRLRGEPRPANVAKLCLALDWTIDSVDRVLRGDPAVSVDALRIGFDGEVPEALAVLPEAVSLLAGEVRRLGQAVDLLIDEARARLDGESELAARLAALEAERARRPSP